MLCFALIESSLGEAARKTFEMLPQNERLMSRLLKERDSRSEAKGEAQALLRVLDRRGIQISPEQRERVLTCSEIATLERWLDRAVTVKSAQDVFAD